MSTLLQGDCCAVTPGLLSALRTLDLPSYHDNALNSDHDCEHLQWWDGKFYRNLEPTNMTPEIFLLKAAATAQASARWSNEEIKRIAREKYPPDTTNDGEPFYTHDQSVRNLYFEVGLRYARDHALLSGEGETETSNWTNEQLDAELRRFGYHPEEVVVRGISHVRDIVKGLQAQTPSCGDCTAHTAEECPNICAFAKNGKTVAATPPTSQVDQAGAIDIPHIHTVYDAVGGGYICTGCDKRFVDQGGTMSREPIAWMDDRGGVITDEFKRTASKRYEEAGQFDGSTFFHIPLYRGPAPSTREKELEEALLRFVTEGQGIPSHPHLSAYVAHDQSVWEQARNALGLNTPSDGN